MMKFIAPFILLILFLFTTYCESHAQNKSDNKIYIEYNENMFINESKLVDGQVKIEFSFNVSSKYDTKSTRYNFILNNMLVDDEGVTRFEGLRFKDINDTISNDKIKNLKIHSITDFFKMKPWDLHVLFSDSKSIFLLKEKDNVYYVYQLK
ncbi:MAG: hypothetical protein KJN82_03910, partial [Bacteroidia bacterium]|nr:hypothetical protein [Bacteroidia bacterium]